MQYDERRRKALWLYAALCPYLDKYLHVTGRIGSPDEVFDDVGMIPDRLINAQQRAALQATRSEAWIDDFISNMDRRGIRAVFRGDDDYPDTLISEGFGPVPPEILFIRGDINHDFERSISIVGTRSADRDGLKIAHDYAHAFAEAGVGVISGFAVGIDSAAAEGALDGGGWYAGVLGCGVDVPYPAQNQKLLRRALDQGGVIMSEYIPGMQAQRSNFPTRNRIIAMISRAVTLIQAPARSGALNTANHALDYGHEVYVAPGSILDRLYAGSNELLMYGASPTISPRDVLESERFIELRAAAEDSAVKQAAPKPPTAQLSDDELSVVTQLRSGAQSYDALIAATNMGAAKLSTVLTMLRLNNIIEELPGRQYAIK